MVQVKVYGNRRVWGQRRGEVSDALHAALVGAWRIPEDKRFHRFLLLEDGDLVSPRSDEYLVIEIVAFTGRSREAKRELIRRVYDDVAPALGVPADDVELVVIESPAESWGIRGRSGDELSLSYTVDV
ncbi:tautomerase family protein [Isoptericola sp. 4D.3]|jgi:phenylpyruvate tautomerase PptA (4-oxalocrotonate tautomerase family)|uniref:Tautomerase family protein n=1 Tax=Isoptericola peretonis TaxID=2918523 RepID=A0ABT0J199_9MICO|nr:tautomerase family protein [Isoptericola sp. 4D.3]